MPGSPVAATPRGREFDETVGVSLQFQSEMDHAGRGMRLVETIRLDDEAEKIQPHPKANRCGCCCFVRDFDLLVEPRFEFYSFALRRGNFSFPALAGFFEMLMLFHLGHDSRFFAGFLKPFQRLFKWLVISHHNSGHKLDSPLSVFRESIYVQYQKELTTERQPKFLPACIVFPEFDVPNI